MQWLSYLPAFAVLLGIVVVIHELGHYWVAKLCGVKVLRFSVGFGKPLLSKRYGPDQTEWALGAFPLGGYVKMLDEREAPVTNEELPRAFNRQSVWKRIAIVVAGPLANLLLAILLFWVLLMIGIPGSKPILGAPTKGSPAAQAGFMSGEKIVAIEGDAISTWHEVGLAITTRLLGEGSIVITTEDAGGGQRERVLMSNGLTEQDLESDFLGKLGLTRLRPGLEIVEVMPDSPALKSGLLAGDEIVALNGTKLHGGAEEFVQIIRGNVGKLLDVDVRRAGATVHLQVTPEAGKNQPKSLGVIGAKVGDRDAPELRTKAVYPPLTALSKAITKTWDMCWLSLKSLARMAIGEVSIKNLSGPVTIANYAGQTAQMGLLQFVNFVALISISLGILNLLPIPLLDGGHLLYYVVEIIKGSPVSEKIMETGQQIGLVLLAGLMFIAFYNDINRLITG
ncbi:MAG: RIP metalloprotease RseP [Burkholderiales bacterium]